MGKDVDLGIFLCTVAIISLSSNIVFTTSRSKPISKKFHVKSFFGISAYQNAHLLTAIMYSDVLH